LRCPVFTSSATRLLPNKLSPGAVAAVLVAERHPDRNVDEAEIRIGRVNP
jgi:hypothetical protein